MSRGMSERALKIIVEGWSDARTVTPAVGALRGTPQPPVQLAIFIEGASLGGQDAYST